MPEIDKSALLGLVAEVKNEEHRAHLQQFLDQAIPDNGNPPRLRVTNPVDQVCKMAAFHDKSPSNRKFRSESAIPKVICAGIKEGFLNFNATFINENKLGKTALPPEQVLVGVALRLSYIKGSLEGIYTPSRYQEVFAVTKEALRPSPLANIINIPPNKKTLLVGISTEQSRPVAQTAEANQPAERNPNQPLFNQTIPESEISPELEKQVISSISRRELHKWNNHIKHKLENTEVELTPEIVEPILKGRDHEKKIYFKVWDLLGRVGFLQAESAKIAYRDRNSKEFQQAVEEIVAKARITPPKVIHVSLGLERAIKFLEALHVEPVNLYTLYSQISIRLNQEPDLDFSPRKSDN